MKHGTEQKIRLLLLYEILQEQTDEEHSLTTQELIALLKGKGIPVVRQTLYEDITMLNEYGYEVLCERVKKNNRYYIVNRKFDRTEIQVLLQAINSARFLTDSKNKILNEKLLSLLGKTEAEQLQDIAVVNKDKYDNERIYYSIDTITSAITERRQLSFLYFDNGLQGERVYRKDKARYVVNPLGIAYFKDNLYLVCYSDKYGNAVNYRVDRMDEVRTEQSVLSEYRDFDITAFMRERFDMYGGESVEVELIFPKDLTAIAVERFGEDKIRKVLNDIVVKATVQVSNTFFAWLTTFVGKVKIISPQKVKEQYKEFLKNNQNI